MSFCMYIVTQQSHDQQAVWERKRVAATVQCCGTPQVSGISRPPSTVLRATHLQHPQQVLEVLGINCLNVLVRQSLQRKIGADAMINTVRAGGGHMHTPPSLVAVQAAQHIMQMQPPPLL